VLANEITLVFIFSEMETLSSWKRDGRERFSTPTTPEVPHEMKSPSNCANQQCHAGGEPREPLLTLNEVKGKDGVVDVRVFADVRLAVFLTSAFSEPVSARLDDHKGFHQLVFRVGDQNPLEFLVDRVLGRRWAVVT
jgi:hypothetical protein